MAQQVQTRRGDGREQSQCAVQNKNQRQGTTVTATTTKNVDRTEDAHAIACVRVRAYGAQRCAAKPQDGGDGGDGDVDVNNKTTTQIVLVSETSFHRRVRAHTRAHSP